MAGQKTNSSMPIVTPAIRDAADPNGVTASSTSAGHATATIEMIAARTGRPAYNWPVPGTIALSSAASHGRGCQDCGVRG